MRKFLLIIFVLAGLVSKVQAQSQPAPIDRLAVDIWSDFDQNAVLVILTGEVDASLPLPAFITIPLPESADLHVVARMDNAGIFYDNLTYNQNNNSVTFNLNDPGFRVEYYTPYQQSGDQRTFDFLWESPVPINQFLMRVQQPAFASPVELSIAPVSTTQEFYELDHYNLPAQTLAAGQLVSLTMSYNLPNGALTETALVSNLVSNDEPAAAIVEQVETANTNWGLVIAGIGAIWLGAIILWWALRQRDIEQLGNKARPTKPKPTMAKYCHQCGNQLQINDQFCRQCGTPRKK
jgi:hypothetical protein